MGPYGAHHTSEKHAPPPKKLKIGNLSKCWSYFVQKNQVS
jgi:hypothetical protein